MLWTHHRAHKGRVHVQIRSLCSHSQLNQMLLCSRSQAVCAVVCARQLPSGRRLHYRTFDMISRLPVPCRQGHLSWHHVEKAVLNDLDS